MWQWRSWTLPVITYALDAARRAFQFDRNRLATSAEAMKVTWGRKRDGAVATRHKNRRWACTYSQVRAPHTGTRATQPNKAFQTFLVEIEQLPHASSNDSFYFLIEAYAVGEVSAVEPNPPFGWMDNLESPIQNAAKCDHKQRRLSNKLTLSNCHKQWLSLTLLECYLPQGFCSEFVGENRPERREFIVVERNRVITHHWTPIEDFGGNVKHRSRQSRPVRY
jgi:hypothetical protein